MRNLGAAIAGGGGTRRENDFYPTPPEATEALLRCSGFAPRTKEVWEPACGDGAIARVLERNGYSVMATDLVNRGYGLGGIDFLAQEDLQAPVIVTNPPFNLAEAFIRKALSFTHIEIVALLLKAQFFHAARRLPLFHEFTPTVIAPLTWRLDFTGGGAPTMDCMWVIWDWSGQEKPEDQYVPLRRPDLAAEMLA